MRSIRLTPLALLRLRPGRRTESRLTQAFLPRVLEAGLSGVAEARLPLLTGKAGSRLSLTGESSGLLPWKARLSGHSSWLARNSGTRPESEAREPRRRWESRKRALRRLPLS